MSDTDPLVSVVAEHLGFGKTDEQADYWADYIARMAIGHDPLVYSEVNDIPALNEASNAIATISRVFSGEGAGGPAQQKALVKLLYPQGVVSGGDEPNRALSDTFFAFLHHADSIKKALDAAVKDMRRSPNLKTAKDRTNYRAIHLVSVAREVWIATKGDKLPPKKLDPATAFARFLFALFEALDIPGEPVPAYTAWAKWQEKPHSSPRN